MCVLNRQCEWHAWPHFSLLLVLLICQWGACSGFEMLMQCDNGAERRKWAREHGTEGWWSESVLLRDALYQ